MSKLKARLIAALKGSADQSTRRVPADLRRFLRLMTGGEQQTARLLRGLLWKRRIFVVVAILSYVLAALFEWSSVAIFTAALEALGGELNVGSVANLGVVGEWLLPMQARLGANRFFLMLLLLGVVTQLLRSGIQLLGEIATSFVVAWTEGDLRRRIFRQFVNMSYAQTSAYKTGDLVSYADQVTYVGRLVLGLNNLTAIGLIAVTYVLAMLWLSWQMTVLAVVALALLSLSTGRLVRRIRSIAREFVQANVTLNEFVVEYLTGLRVIHAFSRQDYAVDNLNRTINQGVRARRLSLSWKATVTPLVEATAIIGIALFLMLGVWLVMEAQLISVARLAIFVFVIYRLLPRITTLNGQVASINNSLPYAERIADILRTDDKAYMRSGTTPFQGLKTGILFDQVSLQYDGGEAAAVDRLQLSIPKGKTVALVGASGSGKTTIVNLLLRLYDPTDGAILVDGNDLRTLRLDAWRERIGVVDQDTFIFNDTVRENIRFGELDASDEAIEEAARVAFAHDFILQLADGYETLVGNRGLRLSGGQRQRIAIARAILRNPDILVFDEATSALDTRSERLIQDALERLRQNRTVVLIAHRLSTVVTADRIVVLDQGRLVEEGTHQALLAQNGRYAALWQLQASPELAS